MRHAELLSAFVRSRNWSADGEAYERDGGPGCKVFAGGGGVFRRERQGSEGRRSAPRRRGADLACTPYISLLVYTILSPNIMDSFIQY